MSEPGITLQAAHVSAGTNTPVNRVVIHATCPGLGYPRASAAGQAQATARYFASSRAGGSAHYCTDIAGETHSVKESAIAWHAPPNSHSLGIEVCGEATYTREQWLSPQVWPAVVRAAARTRDLCARYGVPVVRLGVSDLRAGKRGVCGHVDVSQAFRQSDHSDPGPGFPWDKFMAEVKGGSSGPAQKPAPGARFAYRMLRVGSRGKDVAALQAKANAVYPQFTSTPLAVDGVFGAGTKAFVTEYQRHSGLSDDGIVGPDTWARLATHGFWA